MSGADEVRTVALTGPTPGAGARGSERVSVLAGDRACVKCTFNLVGQHVVREPHYGLLVVICPECGTPAALQEYPVLGRWAGRWAAALAALWLLFVLLLVAGTGGAMFGFSIGAAESSGHKFAQYIAERQLEWAKKQPVTSPSPNGPVTPPAPGAVLVTTILQQGAHPWVQLDPQWWGTQDADALLREAGGWWNAVDREVLLVALWSVLPIGALGCTWAVVASHVRRARLWVILLVVLAFVAAYGAMSWPVAGSARYRWGGSTMAMEIAQRRFYAPVFVGMAGVTAAHFLAGLYAGRPLARLLVRALLPPRMRPPLSFLWRCDGKGLPRPARAAGGAVTEAGRPAGS